MGYAALSGSGNTSADAKLASALSKINSSSSKDLQAVAKQAKQKQANVTAARKIMASPNASAEQIKQATEILNPKKPNSFKAALGSVANSRAGKAAMGLVDLIDTPRAAVVAGLSETTDFLGDALNLPGSEYTDASFREFIKDTRDNKGFGTVLREKTAASAAAGDNKLFGIKIFENPDVAANAPKGSKDFREWLQSEDGGKQLKYTAGGKATSITAGITGDIGLDPLTYVTMGGSKIAGASAEAVASTAMAAGRADIAQKVATKGKWALKADDLKAIGLAGEGGIHFRVPGTGAIGRKTINRQLDEAITTGAIKGTENIMRYTPVGWYQSGRAYTRGGIADRGIAKMLGGKYSDLKDLFAKGTVDEFSHAFNTMQADRIALGREKIFIDDVMRQYSSFEGQIKQLGLDTTDVYNALGDTEDATAAFQRLAQTPEGLNFINEFRTWAQDVLPKRFNEAAGREIVTNFRQGWQPSLRPSETRDFLIETFGEKGANFSKGGPLGKSPFEIKAGIVEGGEFLGETLVSPKEAVLKFGEALTPRQQADRILEKRAAEIGMDQVYAMFETDITKAMPASIRNMAKRVYTAQMESELLNRGVAQSLIKEVTDEWLVPAEMAMAQAKRHIQDMRLEQRTAKAALDDANTILSRIQGRINVRANPRRAARREATTAAAMRAANTAAAEDIRLMNDALAAAQRYTAEIPALRAETNKLLKSIDTLDYLRTPEYTAALDGIKAIRTEIDKTYGVMGRLARKRETLGARLAKLETELQGKAKKAAAKLAERDELFVQMEQIEGSLADLRALHAQTITPELLDDIASTTGVLGQIKDAKGLVDELDHVLKSGDEAMTPKLAELEAKLANNFWADLNGNPMQVRAGLDQLERELTNSLGDMRRHVEAGAPLQSEIARMDETLNALGAQADKLGRTDLMGQVLALHQALPRSEAAALINPNHAEGLWYLGDFSRVSASSAKGFRGSAEGLEGAVGLKLSQEAGEQTGEVIIKSTRPKFYGDKDVLDLAYEHRQFAAYGTKAPTPVRVLRNDMLRDAIEGGTLKPSDLPKQFRQPFERVQKLMAEGHTFDEAVRVEFSSKETKRFLDVRKVSFAREKAERNAGQVWRTGENGSELVSQGELGALIDKTFKMFRSEAPQSERSLWRAMLDGGQVTPEAASIGAAMEDLSKEGLRAKFAKEAGRATDSSIRKDVLSRQVEIIAALDTPAGAEWRKAVQKRLEQFDIKDEYLTIYRGGAGRATDGTQPILNGTLNPQTARVFSKSEQIDKLVVPRSAIIGFGDAQEAELFIDTRQILKSQVVDPLGIAKRSYDVSAVDDSEWLVSTLADRLIGDGGVLSADVKDRISSTFRERLAATHDSVVLPNGKGGWQVLVTDPSVLYDTGGKPVRGISAMFDQYNQMRSAVYKKADDLRATFDQVGTDLDIAHGNFQHLERNLIDSLARKSEIEQRLGQATLDKLDELEQLELFARSEAEDFGNKAAQHRANATRLYQDAVKVGDEMQRAAALDQMEIEHLLAQQADMAAAAKLIEGDMAKRSKELGRRSKKLNQFEGRVAERMGRNIAATGDPMKRKVREVLDDSMKFQVRMLAQDTYAPNYIVQAINDMTHVIGSPNGSEGMLKAFDKVTNLWKAQAITRPGFHIRNYMGGTLNNWIGNVESKSYGLFQERFRLYEQALKGKLDKSFAQRAKMTLGREVGSNAVNHEEALALVAARFGDEDAFKLRQILEAGVVTGGQAAETSMLSHAHPTNWNPFSQSFKAYELNGRAMVHVENHVRGAMAWDRLTKGATVDAMISDVARYHFDYDDISQFERGFVRRLVPFYTWSRKNLPLQVEMLLENPKQVQRFMNIKREIELVSEEEEVTPDWFDGSLNIRLPFKVGGNQAYTFVDMPFKDIATTFNPSKAVEQMNPFVKVPLERRSGTRFFGNIPFQEGYQPVPSIWDDLGIPDVLGQLGWAERNSDGQWMMRDKDLYTVEQWVPFLAQSRRMASDEDRYEKRRVYTWATFFTGQTVRVNTESDKASELYRRGEQLKSYTKDLQTLGYVEKKG